MVNDNIFLDLNGSLSAIFIDQHLKDVQQFLHHKSFHPNLRKKLILYTELADSVYQDIVSMTLFQV